MRFSCNMSPVWCTGSWWASFFHSQKMLLLNTSRSLGFDTVSCIGSIAALLRPQPHRWQRYASWKETHASAPCSVVSWAWIFVATKGVRRSTLLHLCLLDTAILPWRAGLLLANSHCHFSVFQWQMHQVQVCWGSTCPRANPLLRAENWNDILPTHEGLSALQS